MIIDYKYIAVELESNVIQNVKFHIISRPYLMISINHKRHWSQMKAIRFLFVNTSILYYIIFFIIKTIFISMNNFIFFNIFNFYIFYKYTFSNIISFHFLLEIPIIGIDTDSDFINKTFDILYLFYSSFYVHCSPNIGYLASNVS